MFLISNFILSDPSISQPWQIIPRNFFCVFGLPLGGWYVCVHVAACGSTAACTCLWRGLVFPWMHMVTDFWAALHVSVYSDIRQEGRHALSLAALGHQPGRSNWTSFCHSFFAHLLPPLEPNEGSFNVVSNYPSCFWAQSLLGSLFAFDLGLISALCSLDPLLKEYHLTLLNYLYTFHSECGIVEKTKQNPNTIERGVRRQTLLLISSKMWANTYFPWAPISSSIKCGDCLS